MGGALASMGKFKLGVIAAGAAVVALGVKLGVDAVKKAADFEFGMAKVKAISGATAKEFKALTVEAKRLGLITAQTMTDISKGMEVFARAGFNTTEIINAMGGAVALAESQVMDLGTAVDITAGVINSMRLAASDSVRVVNALAAAASSSATTVEDISEAMKYLAPVSADLGVSLEETLTIIGKLADANLRGGRATRALSTGLKRLAAPTDEMLGVMDGLVKKFFDAQGEFIGLIGVVRVLEEAFVGLTAQQKIAALSALFGAESSSHWSILIAQGTEVLEAYRDEITDTTKAFDQQAEMLDTAIGQWQILTGSIELLLVTIGTPALSTLQNLTTGMVDVVNTITEWKEETQASADELKGMGDEAEGAEKKIVSLSDRILDLTGGMVNLKGVVYGVMNALKLIWDATFGILVVAVKTVMYWLVSVIKLLQGDWKGVWEAQKQMYQSLGRYFAKIFGDMGIVFKDFIDEITDWWSDMWLGLKRDMTSFVNFFIARINNIISLINAIPLLPDVKKMELLILPTPTPAPGVSPITSIPAQIKAAQEALRAALAAAKAAKETAVAAEGAVSIITTTSTLLEEALENLMISMSAEGIYKGLKALATDYPESIDAIVARGRELVEGMRARATSLRALADGNQDMILSAVALEAQADALSTSLGTMDDEVGLVSIAIKEAATALELMTISALKMPTKIIEYQVAFGEADPGSYLQAQILSGIGAFYRALISAQELLEKHSIPADAALLTMIASLEAMGFTTEETTKDIDKITTAWAEDYEKVFEAIKAGPASALPIVEQFLSTWQASDTGLMSAVDLLQMLRTKLEGLSSARELVGRNVDELVADLERIAVLLGTVVEDVGEPYIEKGRRGVFVSSFDLTAEAMQGYIDLLYKETSSVGEFLKYIKMTAKHLEDKPQLLIQLHSALEKELRDKQALIPVLKTFGFSTKDAEAAVALLTSALGITEGAATDLAGALGQAAGAARSLASAAQAMAVAQVADIIPEVDRMIAELKAGAVEEAVPPDWVHKLRLEGLPTTTPIPLTLGETAERVSQIQMLQSVVESTRKGLYELNVCTGGVCTSLDVTKEYLDAMTAGMTPEDAAAERERLEKEAAADAKRAADAAASAAKKAANDAVRAAAEAAAEAAREAQDIFKRGFALPSLEALSTGDWTAALDMVKGFAQNRDELVKQAQALAAVNGETLNQADVLQMITGSYQTLSSALDSQIAVMKLAGEDAAALEDFKRALEAAAKGVPSAIEMIRIEDILTAPVETAEKLAKLAGEDAVAVAEYTRELIGAIETEIDARVMFGMETEETEKALALFKETISGTPEAFAKLSDLWSPLKSVLGELGGMAGRLTTGVVDLVQSFVEGGLSIDLVTNAITFVVNMILGFIREKISALEEEIRGFEEEIRGFEEQIQELRKTFEFYASTVEKVASVMNNLLGVLGPLGSILGATATAFTSAIRMLTLDGLDLLEAGMSMLTNYLNSLISTVIGLIQKSDAYQAVQEQGSRMWKAISDLFGQFLWPLAALLKHILDWLGIQETVNEAAAVEIGVPSAWKRERRAYEAAAPGMPFVEPTAGVEIPAWATAIVEGIAEAIEGVLESFGISSWTDLLEKFKAGAIKFWAYVQSNIPKLVSSLTSIFRMISDALGGGVVDKIVGWLKKGFDWLINEAPGAVKKFIEFTGMIWDLIGYGWDWFKAQDWTQIWKDIQAKFAEFETTLEDLIDFTGIETEIGKVTTEIGKVRTAIEGVEAEIERLKTTMKWVIAIAAGAIIGGIGGALAPLTFGWSIAGAALGALAGGAIGALIAGFFAEGGIIPGPIGSPQVIMGHGGEEVVPYNKRGQATNVFTEVRVYLGQEEVTDFVLERIQRRSKLLTGSRSTAAGLTRRYA